MIIYRIILIDKIGGRHKVNTKFFSYKKAQTTAQRFNLRYFIIKEEM